MKKQNGITLIALVITIIVMLILVGVSVTVALNGGLFGTAEKAASETATKRNEELELSSGKVQINGEWYDSMQEYANVSGNGGQQGGNLENSGQQGGTYGYFTYTINENGEATITGIDDEYFFWPNVGDPTVAEIRDGETEITELVIPSIITGGDENYPVKSIGYWSFPLFYNLTNVVIPDGVTTIEDMAFVNCYALEILNIPNSVTSIEGLPFNYGTMLNFPNGKHPDLVIPSDNWGSAGITGINN